MIILFSDADDFCLTCPDCVAEARTDRDLLIGEQVSADVNADAVSVVPGKK